MGPVIDVDGRVVLLVKVARGELTCTVCGEVTVEPFCRRCNQEGSEDDDRLAGFFGNVRASSGANLVPTVSYLRDDEFVEV